MLYLLLFLLRWQQGGWDIEIDLFPKIRQTLDQKIGQLLPTPQAELLSGILLGEKKNIPGQLRLALRDTSTLHIVVVSGQNLTILAGLFMNLSGLLKRKVAILISVLAIVGFTLLTGGQVPILRAAIMAILALTAQIFGRLRDGVWVLLITCSLMLLINPLWIKDLSFQLSFLATFGVIVVAPQLLRLLKNLPQFLSQDLTVTIGAQVMVLPVIAQNFHQLSLVGIATNLLILWTVPFIMVTGALMIILGSFWQFAGEAVALVINVLLTYFIYIVQFFASLSFAWEYVGEQSWLVWMGYYLILAGVLMAINML